MSARVAPPLDLFPEPMTPAASSMAAWVAPKVESLAKRKRRAMTVPQIDKARAGVARRVSERDWKGASPSELVALFEWLHRSVYEVAPRMNGTEWSFASCQAARMVAKEFGGDFEEAVDFVRWTWAREQGREKWRREHGREANGITWRQQFMTAWLLTDYRIDCARKAAR